MRRSFILRKARTYGRKLRRIFSLNRGPAQVDLEDIIEFSHFPEHELKLWQIHLQALAEHVEKWPPGELGLIFHDRNGQPVRRSTFYRSWRKATERADEATRVHALFTEVLKQHAAQHKKLGVTATAGGASAPA